MSDTLKRDQATELAKRAPDKALNKARTITNPWFRAQALAGVARYAPSDTLQLAAEVNSSRESFSGSV